ncbi:MAG: 2OG-Fe dioxygenase family protein [Deltaproteobacteria bacterium]|nr:2OG-Fe dioxygenase family protein [Deltaproteobacteria bacterium]
MRRFAEAARGAPYDPYDPALNAEVLVRSELPELYRESETAWLKKWALLHEVEMTEQKTPAAVEFWLERLSLAGAEIAKLSALKSYRRRSCRRYLVERAARPYSWKVLDVGTPVFAQKVDDIRARVRQFAMPPKSLLDDADLLRLMGVVCEFVSAAPGPKPHRYQLTFHLMLTEAEARGSKPAPEGVHQDGANYIVSALVLERENVIGGESHVLLNRDGPAAIESIQLAEGQGLLQSDIDHDLWHGVTKISRLDPEIPGHRSILGLDIDYL